VSTYSANHKPLPEYDIDPADIPAIEATAREQLGVRRDKARNLAEFLRAVHGVSHRSPDDFAEASKTTYRKMLRELGAVPTPPTGDDHPPRMYESVKLAALPMAA
jgi:hypothetical protein